MKLIALALGLLLAATGSSHAFGLRDSQQHKIDIIKTALEQRQLTDRLVELGVPRAVFVEPNREGSINPRVAQLQGFMWTQTIAAPTGCPDSFDNVVTAPIELTSAGGKMLTVYAGHAFTLQEFTGHSTQAIDWVGSPFPCTPDYATANTFCSGKTCGFKIINDQGGHGCDLTQTTESKMVVYTAAAQNGLATQVNSGLGQYTCTLPSAMTAYTAFITANISCAGGGSYLLNTGNNTFTTGGTVVSLEGGGTTMQTTRYSTTGTSAQNLVTSGTNVGCGAWDVIVNSASGTLDRVFVNGGTYADNTTSMTLGGDTNIYYMYRFDNSHQALGSFGEMAIFANMGSGFSISSGDGAIVMNAMRHRYGAL